MSIFAAAFSSPTSQKSGSLRDLLRTAAGRISASGQAVNSKTAIQVATVYACCRVIGEGVAQVPLKIMQTTGKTRLPATNAPLYDLLGSKPNPWQTSFEYREMLVWHAVLGGNHFSFINRGSGGKILELVPFSPGQVTVKRAKDWSLSYVVRANDGESQTFPAESIWHVKGPSWDGWNALEPVKLAREAIGLAMATEEAAGALHKNGVRPSGVYSVEGKLVGTQYKELSDWIDTHQAGAANTGKPLILDRAAKWVGTQMTGTEAQSYETRRFQIEEICRFARVMPIMVGHADKVATYASSEQMFLAHVVHTLAPWYQRLEQSIDAFLLTAAERNSGIYSNFVEEGLLRGSALSTKDTILGYVNGGLMTANEGRAKLDMNPDPNPLNDQLRIPVYITAEAPTKETNI